MSKSFISLVLFLFLLISCHAVMHEASPIQKKSQKHKGLVAACLVLSDGPKGIPFSEYGWRDCYPQAASYENATNYIVVHALSHVLDIYDRYSVLLQSYPVGIGSKGPGKTAQGDQKTPLGEYHILWKASRYAETDHYTRSVCGRPQSDGLACFLIVHRTLWLF